MFARSQQRLLAWFLPTVFALPAASQGLARFTPAPFAEGRPLELRFVREGRAGLQAWPTGPAGWLFVRESGGQRNLATLAPSDEDATRLSFERSGTGPALVGWDLPARVERFRASGLRAFLEERAGASLPSAIAASTDPVAVLCLESLALVAGAPGGSSAIPVSKSGQRMELRALLDPSRQALGSEFAFKLYLPEGGSEDVWIRAVHLESRATHALQLLPGGSLRTRLEQPGAWLLEAVRVRVLEQPSGGATLELASATLVFEVSATIVREQPGGGR